ncbi:unnamed protein product [Mytilus coruscus]|uniref:Uncharacterized protein n=1 Tax=Mytilus coruscus TaxID=42192 RepID=A0A6J8D8K4_MYTCO|nr:unnamed protein product [Mytilus coruscus]
MSDSKEDEISLQDNFSASGDLADELHVDHAADIDEARGYQSNVRSDNSLSEKHIKKRKGQSMPSGIFLLIHQSRRVMTISKRRKRSKATKYGSRNKKSSKKDDFYFDSEADKEVRSVISETVSNLTYSDKNGNKSYNRFNPHKKEKNRTSVYQGYGIISSGYF